MTVWCWQGAKQPSRSLDLRQHFVELEAIASHDEAHDWVAKYLVQWRFAVAEVHPLPLSISPRHIAVEEYGTQTESR